jgi:sugar O-acyltransferase (sialic acid O-acetyltransferase NeuD family)
MTAVKRIACTRVLIVGAGAHGQVVADILRAEAEDDESTGIQVIGYLDDDPALMCSSILNLPILGTIAQVSGIAHDAVIVAIGDNSLRRQVCVELVARGEQLASAIHPSAIIGSEVRIGPGSMVCPGVVINVGTRLGKGVILNTGCTVDHHNQIGDYVQLAPGAHLGGRVKIGEGTLVGIGAVVAPDRSIGSWGVIGAGAAVIEDIPARALAVGVPAHVKRANYVSDDSLLHGLGRVEER